MRKGFYLRDVKFLIEKVKTTISALDVISHGFCVNWVFSCVYVHSHPCA